MKIAISIGHNPRAQGRTHKGTSEYAECAIHAGWAVQSLTKTGHKALIVPTGSLKEKVDWINARDFDLAVEFHLNGAKQTAKGCEVLYYKTSEVGKWHAENLSGVISFYIGNRNRGAKPRTGLYFLRKTNCPAIIVEPFFMVYEFELLSMHKAIGTALADIL